jgi:xanthine dehydrogenase accessory factor
MIVILRGGGDLASGVAVRLYRAGIRVVIAELPQPLAIRRLVSFAEAIYAGETRVEEIGARKVSDPTDTLKILQVISKGLIPVLIDPEAVSIPALHPHVVVDARMLKRQADLIRQPVKLIIGLGPGFTVGENCHAVIETRRGHKLGRVYWQGSAEADSGEPDPVAGHAGERVLRAPADGVLESRAAIGDHLEKDQPVAEVDGVQVLSPFGGVLRGLIHDGIQVTTGIKIGDVDPRDDPRLASLVSDKALAVGGGVLEAILSKVELRPLLWTR